MPLLTGQRLREVAVQHKLNIPVDVRLNMPAFLKDSLKAMVDHINQIFRSGYKSAVRARVTNEAIIRLKASPEYLAITSDAFRGQLGLRDPISLLQDIFQRLTAAMEVDALANLMGTTITGGAEARLSRADYTDVLSSAGASFISEGTHTVEWLRWLLTSSGAPVVAGYHFVPRNAGRTTLGVMVKKGWWAVPPALGAASPTDNFILRGLLGFSQTMSDILLDELTKRF
jgi:hypothetical protein